ncbi:hypothetical protein MKL09_25325, partial [Methylobacterium sp. J-048]|uniref:hypothetical protein n=1 Tax=Methylobacterium sp. J-048 TaxID=2836635 RepID=UPI001FBBC975
IALSEMTQGREGTEHKFPLALVQFSAISEAPCRALFARQVDMKRRFADQRGQQLQPSITSCR